MRVVPFKVTQIARETRELPSWGSNTEIHTTEPLVPEPSAFEIKLVIEKIKSHKLPDTEQIPAELIKAGDSWGNLRERDHLGDPGVDGRIILRLIFRKWDVGVWTG